MILMLSGRVPSRDGGPAMPVVGSDAGGGPRRLMI